MRRRMKAHRLNQKRTTHLTDPLRKDVTAKKLITVEGMVLKNENFLGVDPIEELSEITTERLSEVLAAVEKKLSR